MSDLQNPPTPCEAQPAEGTPREAHPTEGNPREAQPAPKAPTWSYLFTHHASSAKIAEKIAERFPVFVHRTVVYKKVDKRIVKQERDTIAGLVFVCGEPAEIQAYLNDHFIDMRLAWDSASRTPARISDAEMRTFMRIASADGRSVRFMLHPIDDYARGRQRVTVLSGPLQGLEGYVVRLGRDRCLVTSIGNFTVAIGGIHKEVQAP